MTSNLPPPSPAQRWLVKHRVAIRVGVAVFLLVVLGDLLLSAGRGEARSPLVSLAFGAALAGLYFALELQVRRYVSRWDEAHDKTASP